MSPSIKEIADFLLHLCQEKNLQPSTSEGYRSAITDKIKNSSLNISKNENLVSWTFSIGTNPQGIGGFPLENFPYIS